MTTSMNQRRNSYVVRNLLYSLWALAAIFLVGTLGYHILGGPVYTWQDCFYMTFVTIATIGYAEVVDVMQYEYGRMFTVFVGMSGIGVLGYVLSTFTAFMLESDLNIVWRRNMMQKKINKMSDHYLVCGLGLVGKNVAHDLEKSGRPFVVIESDLKNIELFLEHHPEQLYMHADATDNDVLLAAGVLRARGVFAVAREDSTNLVISLSAKQLNADLRVVARCHDMKNVEKTRRVGADEVVSPDFSGGQRIVSAMLRPNVLSFLDEMLMSEGDLRLEEIRISHTMTGQPISVLYNANNDCMVLALQRQGSWQVSPQMSCLLQDKDVLMVMLTQQGRMRVEGILAGA